MDRAALDSAIAGVGVAETKLATAESTDGVAQAALVSAQDFATQTSLAKTDAETEFNGALKALIKAATAAMVG